ncbi:kinase-like domain-containing protein [Glomus cerebriforme]|uniref:Kinase-like domain-containing protein n=1 Tax=Glomus cerebriforme TaxID=658196 RepID=A0A397SM60_9GLOM|nr:kinase-like domain-containing protein [Glomus cerebriforme]
MEQTYLSDNILEQIKDFGYYNSLNEEQKLLIDKLILNEELKERYKMYDLCKECKQPNTSNDWCQLCNAKHFQQNFKNWTSGNPNVDKLIQKSQIDAKNNNKILEWIEYDRIENIEYITKGGFGTIYKAIWKKGWISRWNYKINQWDRTGNMVVALKSLNNSKDITMEFLNEINSHLKMSNSYRIIRFYGITKDPKTNDFMIIMDYAPGGNLRQKLNRDFNSLDWKDKIFTLREIARGLYDIHKEGLTHQDFHSGNILNLEYFGNSPCITDLGLSKPANENFEKRDKEIYGVLPYVAPEVLRGKKYTQKSDVYSFGIIIYEVFNGLPPYYDMPHDEFLAIKICQGLRPRFNIKVPQLIDDIFKKCVVADILKRPTAEYLYATFDQWWNEIYKQNEEVDEYNKKLPTLVNTELMYTTHPQAIYTSRLLNFNNLLEQKNEKNAVYSESIEPIDFTQLNIINFQGKY